jgi:Mg-chelatase subunit ChlD
MKSPSRPVAFACFAIATIFAAFATRLAAAPLNEKGLNALIAAGFDDQEIVAKLEKDGVAFDVNDEAIQRLKQAGASEAVLKSVTEAGKRSAPTPAGDAKPIIAFDNIIALLESGIEPNVIIARLNKSAATYTLSADQEKHLRDAGATDELIRAMKEGGKGADTPEPISDLALVLDVSASMNEKTSDGRAKIDVAKEVVSELVRRIPEGLNVSVVVYGHAPGCSAVKVLRPLSELKAADREPLASQLQGLQPVGNTPIALALRQAGEQFANRKTYCGVVLITDGMESCNGNPSAEAARLAANPMLRFGVNVVGFGLKPAESAATAEIAKSGNGKYYDAQDGAQLLEAIGEVTKKLEKSAKPAPFNPEAPKGRRAIVVVQPQIKMPSMKEIVTTKAGDASAGTLYAYKINGVNKYDSPLRQANAEPVDIWWVPEKGKPVVMVSQFENSERETKKLRPEDYLGMVRVTAEDAAGKVRVIATTPDSSAGTIGAYEVQETDGYNQDMVLPAGTYKLWLVEEKQEPTLLEEEVQVAGGQVTAIEY